MQKNNRKKICIMLIAVLQVWGSISIAHAQPYGMGSYGADVPYGSQTSLSIATNGNVAIQITPDTNAILGTANNVVTVTSTDVVGYRLYIRSFASTDMDNGGAVLPASSNVAPGTLTTNTWGYNVSGSSTNFSGLTNADVLIKSASGPFSAGDATTITYGVKIDNAKPAGNYTTTVQYTAAPQTD